MTFGKSARTVMSHGLQDLLLGRMVRREDQVVGCVYDFLTRLFNKAEKFCLQSPLVNFVSLPHL